MIFKSLVIYIILIFSVNAIEIVYPNRGLTGTDDYGYQVLKLVLSKVNKGYNVTLDSENSNQERAIYKVKTGEYQVVDLGVGNDYPDELKPIFIPIDRGILGWRIFIIRNEDKKIFSSISSLKQLEKYQAGQGTNWSDNEILRSSGITVIESYKIENLFAMLENKRFDFLPLGVNEAQAFLNLYSSKNSNLTIDKHIVLVYPFARFFYVNYKNTTLIQDINKGLELAYEDGSFQNLFKNHKYIKFGLEKAEINDRIIINIDNPFMKETINKIDKKWWYKP